MNESIGLEVDDEPERLCPRCGDSWPDDAEFYRPGRTTCLACDRERKNGSDRRQRLLIRLAMECRELFPDPVVLSADPPSFELADYARSTPVTTPRGFVGALHRDWHPDRPRKSYRLLSWKAIADAFSADGGAS